MKITCVLTKEGGPWVTYDYFMNHPKMGPAFAVMWEDGVIWDSIAGWRYDWMDVVPNAKN